MYYSIHGSDKDGWSLYIYQYVESEREPGIEVLSPLWPRRKHFKSFEDICLELRKYHE